MRVSELARRSGIASSAIRFYESAGVLPPAQRRANGYREYDEQDLCRVRVLASLRALGIELDESARLADMCSKGECDEMQEQLLPRIATRRAELAAAGRRSSTWTRSWPGSRWRSGRTNRRRRCVSRKTRCDRKGGLPMLACDCPCCPDCGPCC